jgi:hypothetical protein
MRRVLRFGLAAALVATPVALVTNGTFVANSAPHTSGIPDNKTIDIAGPQHFCGTNGVTCAEPSRDWDEFAGFDKAVKAGAHMLGYIGHDEPATLFYSNEPGSGNDVTYRMRLPQDPPTRPRQDGSGGTYNFQDHVTFWLGMVMCDPNGSPNPDGAELDGHPTAACTPDSDTNIYNSQKPSSSHYFGLGPGQAYEEMQFYAPGWAPWPAGIGCTKTQWCAALNIDTFQDNENTGDFNNTDCLNTVGPEPVNFAFITKSGVASDPANPFHPEHFTPDLKNDYFMNSGDNITVHLFDTANGLKVQIDDHTTGKSGSMTASAANGFGSVVFDPNASNCQLQPLNYHPEFSTSTPATRNVDAAHTYNVAFSDEIGHFEYCAKVGNDDFSTCLKPLGNDTNDADNAGPDPEGDDDFCIPASDSLDVKIGGCLDIDGDFDSPAYQFTWPGSISNPVADALLNFKSFLFSSPTTHGHDFTSMAFESDASRNESDDTAFRVDTFCQRHLQNPADPDPGSGCVNPPPNAEFYPFYSTTSGGSASGARCMWQEGGRYIPGTTNLFGGSAAKEYGPLRAISYPADPFGTVTKRFNDFRQNLNHNPCPTG